MAGGEGVNQVGGVAVHDTQPQSFDEGVERASNPQRLNRSSIESVPGAKRKVFSPTGESKEFPPLSSRKVTLQPLEKFRLLLSRPKKEINLQDLGGVRQQNITLSKAYDRQAPKAAKNKTQAEQQVKGLNDGLKWAKSNHKKAVKLASSVALKQSIADKTGVPAELKSAEREALKQLDQAQDLVGKFESKLAEAKAGRSEFKTVEKLKDSFSSRLEKLEKKISAASRSVDARLTPLSVNDYKSRVSELEKKLAVVESVLKDLNQLGQDVAVAEEGHAGTTPERYAQKVQKLLGKAETVRAKGPEVLQKAKTKRDQVLEQQANFKRAKKQAARDQKEINKAYEKANPSQSLSRARRVRAPEIQTRTQTKAAAQPQPGKDTLKKRVSQNDLNKHNSARAKSRSKSNSTSSASSGTTRELSLENRLKRLRDEVYHEPITPSGNAKNFEQLKKELFSISSVDDLKTVVANRRSSKITIDQQQRYLGLLSAAVQGMAKNAQYAEKMDEDLIRDVLKEQPDEARAAIKKLSNTRTDILQRRLDRLRKD